jgi:hypothetical protein
MSEPYRERHQKAGKDMDEFLEIEDPADTLDAVAKCIRRATQQSKGKLKRQLAVVLTKCDMDGLFDPDADEFRGRFPVQSGEYDPATAADISRQVLNLIHDDLDMPGVVAKAVENFEDVSFFAVSSLGTAPQWVEDDYGGRSLKLVDPRPRRVEEPLLWILHRWGYL